MCVAEDLGVRRVGDLAIERDDVAARRAQRGQRVAVGLASRDVAPDVVLRQP